MEETSTAISLSDLQVQDIDNLQTELVLQVQPGTSYTYSGNTVTPGLDFNGELTVNVKVSDLQSSSSVFGFKLNVTASNDIPVIVSGNEIVMNEDETLTLIKTNFQVTDPDNVFPQDYTLVVQNGTNYTRSGNSITPVKDFNGELDVHVKMRDQLDISNEFIHTISVLPVNDPPSILIPTNRDAVDGEYFEIELTTMDVDQDDLLELTALQTPAWLTFNNITGILGGTPGTQNIGNHSVRVRADDQSTTTDSLFTIHVGVKSALEETDNSIFRIYPNPASDHIRIETDLSAGEELRFRLINASGMTVMDKTLPGSEANIALPTAIPPGLYLYQVKAGEFYQQGKITIDHAR
jgi:hypothetical protein